MHNEFRRHTTHIFGVEILLCKVYSRMYKMLNVNLFAADA